MIPDLNKRQRAGLQRLTLEEEVYTKDKPPPIEGQLQAVLAHIEDLHVSQRLSTHSLYTAFHDLKTLRNLFILEQVVIDRVSLADNLSGYDRPLISEFSELRLDY